MCNNGEVEDEVHVLFKCEAYCQIRSNLFGFATDLEADFKELTETDKVRLLVSHPNILRKTSNFLKEVLAIRQKFLRVND